jgi:serine/threonine protein kinase/Tfp pilus assembly protein PilF
MIGETIDHYRILSEIGAGGMGTVYRARDEILRRDVALKLLRSEKINERESRAHILHEARAAASLNHPHICTVYQVGEFQGASYIAMEHVDGQSLSTQVQAGGLPLELILRYAVQIADALAHAHARGVIHRDLKTANVVITTQGQVKVLDFGLAKRILEDANEETRSMLSGFQGSDMMGTLPYMAPEILIGETADVRTDIWSFGVLLYNLATGELPFKGRTNFELTSSILKEIPDSSAITNPSLRTLILRCLAKKREQRYQEASEVKAALEILPTSRGRSIAVAGRQRDSRRKINSVAVLPFENKTGDPDAEYLSEGITESIINSLAQLTHVRVVPRNSVFRYKDLDMDPRSIGEELAARSVLVGRILVSGDRLMVRIELIDVAKNSLLWGDEFNRPRSQIFEVQDEIASEISENLRLRLTPSDKKRLRKHHTRNTDAYYLYLKARYFWNKRTPTAFKQAILHYEEAIATDPEFALAYAGLADCHIVLGTFAFVPMAESFRRGKDAAEKALALDPFLGEAHTSLAIILSIYEHRWHMGEIQFKKSISLRPDYATAHHWYSFCLCAMGRVPEGIAEISKAEELDPLAPIILTNFGTVLYWARQYDRALEQYHKVLSLSPEFWTAHWMMGLAYEQKHNYEDAAEEMRAAMKFFPGTSAVLSASLARVYALSGSAERALELASQVKNQDDAAVRCPYHLAMVYASLGQNDAAFEWLDKAFEAHDMWINFLKVDPKMDSLRRSPGYIELLRRIALPD